MSGARASRASKLTIHVNIYFASAKTVLAPFLFHFWLDSVVLSWVNVCWLLHTVALCNEISDPFMSLMSMTWYYRPVDVWKCAAEKMSWNEISFGRLKKK